MIFQVLVIAALLSGFVLLGLGVVGIRPNREIQWVPVDARSRGGFILLGALLLLVGGWWYLEPPDTDIGTTQSLMPVDSAFTSGNSEISPNAVRPADEEAEVPPKEPDAANATPASPGPAEPSVAPSKSLPAAPADEVAESPPATPSDSPPPAAPAPGDDLSPAAQALEQDRRAPKSGQLGGRFQLCSVGD